MSKPLLARGSWPEAKRFAEILRRETVGGLLLLFAASAASSGQIRLVIRLQDRVEWSIGPASLHLNLSLATWAADGLLAIFFFVVGWNSSASSSPAT